MKTFEEYMHEDIKKVHPDLAKLGVAPEHVEMFKKVKETSRRPNVTNDPYSASTGNKAAYTRSFNKLHNSLTAAGINTGLAYQKMRLISDYHGDDKLYENV